MEVNKLFLAQRLYSTMHNIVLRKENGRKNSYVKIDPVPWAIEAFFRDNIVNSAATYHEVLMKKRKLFFDLDGPPNSFGQKEVNELIQACVNRIPGIDPDGSAVLVLWSTEPEVKASCHVVFSTTLIPCGDIAQDLMTYISDAAAFRHIDMKVYTNNHCLRVPLSKKRGTNRQFSCELSGDFLSRVLVTCSRTCLYFAQLHSNSKTKKPVPFEALHKDILLWSRYITERVDTGLSFRRVKDGRFMEFDRNQGGYCRVCSRFHERENPYFDLKSLKFYCRRGTKEKGVTIELRF
ncbi:hypothetical protein GpartN1_g1918.t1 [Galdieria partita]|uniref:Uncharacterized protein n=1 Tax=Galdieria partita TaxID=83374 RepID=A0A9C7PUG6_9RHOD|nr:hypothetical protein GpartN1_g1918.t1 [Galdieria partita]